MEAFFEKMFFEVFLTCSTMQLKILHIKGAAMAINYVITSEGNYLIVKASGKDDNLAQVKEYGIAVITAAVASEAYYILCDETELEYSLDVFDTFESARFIAEHAPRIAKVAIVCNPKQMHDAEFWETVAVNRGLQIRVFQNMDSANSWLGRVK